jgi:anti-anti-sigma factor
MQTEATINNRSFYRSLIEEPGNAVEVNMGLKINTATIQDQTAILVCEGQIVRGEEINVLYGTVILQQSPLVVLDLSSVARIDAAGLGVLVACYQALLVNKRRLVLQNPSAYVRELLHTTNLHLLFEIAYSEAQPHTYELCEEAAG